jgi:hypothetical protein
LIKNNHFKNVRSFKIIFSLHSQNYSKFAS